jgi:hypothetical protein
MVHNQGRLQMTVSNTGQFASNRVDMPIVDPLTGDRVIKCEYPRNSGIIYGLDAALAIGGIIDGDTMVSWYEYMPDQAPFGGFTLQTMDQTQDFYSSSAQSLLDATCHYFDTVTNPDVVGYDHRPLELRVDQTSMAWAGANLGEFVLFEFRVTTTNEKRIDSVYVGIAFSGSVAHEDRLSNPTFYGPLTGFLRSWSGGNGCLYLHGINLAYTMDADGDPVNETFDYRSPLGAVGIAILDVPSEFARLSNNWLVYDPQFKGGRWWQPQRRPPPGVRIRDLTEGGIGWPITDATLFYIMANGELDYDQVTAAVDHSHSGWLPAAPSSDITATGKFSNTILSSGPFSLGRGQELVFAVAVVAGDSVHHDPTAHETLFDPKYPGPFYNQLDFSNLAENAMWAKWVYDNPGVDSDGDGYFGEFRMCEGDTFWYQGDGVPDFRADVPPPAPEVRIIPSIGKLVIRWNGYYSETNVDPFTRIKDFEGYRVYVGLDSRKSSLSLLSSWDYENYNRYTYAQYASGAYKWVGRELPFTLDSLKVIYQDPNFDPLLHTRENPLKYNDTLYYFTKQDYNISDTRNQGEIHKVYPDAPKPPDDTALWTEDDLTYEHGEPLPKYYEYDYIYDGLPATLSYFVGVTAFDFGFARGGIPSKESNVLNNLIESYAQSSVEDVEEQQLDVYVYPNPWRSDADYLERGFENRDQTQINSRSHRIHFTNLPRVCTIKILSLDGDLIRTIEHNYSNGGPEAMHDYWDFITKNTQDVVSGLYYYVVESENRTQIGKFVIIR